MEPNNEMKTDVKAQDDVTFDSDLIQRAIGNTTDFIHGLLSLKIVDKLIQLALLVPHEYANTVLRAFPNEEVRRFMSEN
jgi:hypothetical protein